MHNFTWENKIKVFEMIHSKLSSNGMFALMDKVYPDDSETQKNLLDKQLHRFQYLNQDLRNEIIQHEKQDLLDKYRMEELKTIQELQKIGFKSIKIEDRIEMDVLLVAGK